MANPAEKGNQFQEILSRLASIQATVKNGKADEKAPVIPLIDPTSNVLSLVAAAIARQDDLRVAENKRVDDLRILSEKCSHEIQQVRDVYQKELAEAESKRINAITLAESRRIDALLSAASNAVALASEKAATQAATLAAQVTATGTATAAQIGLIRESLEKRLQIVEQNQYQSGGATQQRSEGQLRNQWVIGIIIVIALGLFATISHILK